MIYAAIVQKLVTILELIVMINMPFKCHVFCQNIRFYTRWVYSKLYNNIGFRKDSNEIDSIFA